MSRTLEEIADELDSECSYCGGKMTALIHRAGGGCSDRDPCPMDAHPLATEIRAAAKAEREELWAARITLDESNQMFCEVFGWLRSIVNGTDADRATAIEQIRRHVGHVEACRKGSCATELGLNTESLRKAEREACAERFDAAVGRCLWIIQPANNDVIANVRAAILGEDSK